MAKIDLITDIFFSFTQASESQFAFKTFGPCKWHIRMTRVVYLFDIVIDIANKRSVTVRLSYEMRYMPIFVYTYILRMLSTGTRCYLTFALYVSDGSIELLSSHRDHNFQPKQLLPYTSMLVFQTFRRLIVVCLRCLSEYY